PSPGGRMIGRTLSQYRIESKLGAGGMGEVESPTPRVVRLICKLTAARAIAARQLPDPLEHLAHVESGVPFEQAGVVGFLDDIPSDAADVTAAEVIRAQHMADGTYESPGELYMKLQPRGLRHGAGEY